MASLRSLLILSLLATAACGSDDTAAPDDAGVDSTPTPDAMVDPTEVVFPRDRVIEVSISMAATDWDTLRMQEPDQPDATCADPTATGSYDYFPATITIDGVTTSNVGVRKKGNLGSLSTTRPGLKVKANEYVMGQKIASLKQLTLNNNHQDPTLISQCLGYSLFRAAGVPAPRCAFAHVKVNGTDLGIYSNVESIRDQFLTRNFGTDTGHVYESGGDFALGQTGGFQPKDTTDCADVDAVASAAAAPDAQFPSRIDAVVDVEEMLKFWALEVVTSHWDGYANNRNNYLVYHDPTTDKFSFIPWGTDALFSTRTRTTRPQSVYACGALAWRMYSVPATRTRYLAALRSALDAWDETAILAEIDRMQALLMPFADAQNTGAFAEKLAPVRQFVQTREAALRSELAAGDPVWPYPADQSCLISLGTFTATFQTTWGTLGSFTAGSGTMSGTIGGVNATTSTVTGGSGLDTEGKAMTQLFGRMGDGRYAVLYIGLDPANFHPGTFAVDLRNVFGYLTFYDPVTDTATGGGLMFPGTLTLQNAAMTTNATVRGTLTGSIIEL